ncbi:MAG: ABC transporter permease subunit [Candidatus Latescibacteria bacterium]|nr:ABC transporter permease subunit [Candidatus Latescibacterota bacterium]
MKLADTKKTESVIFTIFKMELLDHFQRFRFTFITMLSILLIIVATIINVENYRQKLDNYLSASRQHKESLKNVKVYSRLNPNIEHKPEVLEILSQGITGQFSPTVNVQRTRMPEFKPGSTVDNEYLAVIFEIDISYVISVIFSLMGLLLAFDAINGDRRNGNLKMILANRVHRYKVLIAKSLGGISILSISLAFGFICCMLVMINSPGIMLDSGDWLRIGGLFISSLIYASLFYMLGLLLSAIAREPATALAFSLFFWVVLVIIWPGAVRYFGKQLFPIPSLEYLQRNEEYQQLDTDEIYKLYGNFHEAGSGGGMISVSGDGTLTFNSMGGRFPPPDQDKLNFLIKKAEEINEVIQEQNDREWQIRANYVTQQMRQYRIIHIISSFSPAYLYAHITSILSRTDIGSYSTFMEHIYEFRSQIIQWLNDIDAIHSQKWFVEAGELDLNGLSEFSTPRIPFRECLSHILLPVSELLFLTIVLFLIAHVVFLRNDVS